MAVDEKIKRELRVLNAYPISIDYVSGTNMVPIEFFLKDVVLPYGASAKIFVRKPSGAVVFENCTLDMETNSIEVVPTAQMFAEAGESIAQIQIIDSQDLINSYPITFNVYPMLPEDEAVVSTNEFGAFQTLLNSAMSISYAAVQEYIEDHGLTQGATPAQAAAIQQNTGDIAQLQEDVQDIQDQLLDISQTAYQYTLEHFSPRIEQVEENMLALSDRIDALLARIENIENSLISRSMTELS